MPCYLLSAEASFSAAHSLPGIEKCDRVHGHNWRVRLTVRADQSVLDATGIGVDFRTIEAVAEATVADFDHANLNDLDVFDGGHPTAERLARIVFERAAARLEAVAPTVSIEQVDVWEMPGFRAAYRPE